MSNAVLCPTAGVGVRWGRCGRRSGQWRAVAAAPSLSFQARRLDPWRRELAPGAEAAKGTFGWLPPQRSPQPAASSPDPPEKEPLP